MKTQNCQSANLNHTTPTLQGKHCSTVGKKIRGRIYKKILGKYLSLA